MHIYCQNKQLHVSEMDKKKNLKKGKCVCLRGHKKMTKPLCVYVHVYSVYMRDGAIVRVKQEKKGVCQRVSGSTMGGRLRWFFQQGNVI